MIKVQHILLKSEVNNLLLCLTLYCRAFNITPLCLIINEVLENYNSSFMNEVTKVIFDIL